VTSEQGAPTEVERLTAEYEQRDKGGVAGSIYSFSNPGYVFHVQDIEWELLRAFRDHDVELADCDVLEVGVGFGTFLQRVVDFGARSGTGIDVLPWRIDQARERYPKLELVTGDAAALPFEDNRFQITMQLTCLTSVLDAETRKQIASEMQRVTAPGGLIVSYDMRPTPLAIRMMGRAYSAIRRLPRDTGTPTIALTAADVENLFGVSDSYHRTVTLNFELAALAARSRVFAQLLRAQPWLRTHELVVIRQP
jgi:SAM-dependent methyltransferase